MTTLHAYIDGNTGYVLADSIGTTDNPTVGRIPANKMYSTPYAVFAFAGDAKEAKRKAEYIINQGPIPMDKWLEQISDPDNKEPKYASVGIYRTAEGKLYYFLSEGDVRKFHTIDSGNSWGVCAGSGAGAMYTLLHLTTDRSIEKSLKLFKTVVALDKFSGGECVWKSIEGKT